MNDVGICTSCIAVFPNSSVTITGKIIKHATKNESKPAKRAKLLGIARFFTEPRQEEQTSISATHISSDTSNNLPSTSSTPIVNQLQSNTTYVNNPSTTLAESVELDRDESQGIACTSISSPSQHNENNLRQLSLKHLSSAISLQRTDALVNQYRLRMQYLDKPNHPDVSVSPAQKLSKRTLYFQSKWYEDYEWIHYDSDWKKVLCFYSCLKASAMGVPVLVFLLSIHYTGLQQLEKGNREV